MGRVTFEMDCLGLQQAITTEMLDRSSVGAMFREIKFLLQLAFIDWNVTCCPIVCNMPAHVLAAPGRRGVYGVQHVWLVNLPSDVTDVVIADLVDPR